MFAIGLERIGSGSRAARATGHSMIMLDVGEFGNSACSLAPVLDKAPARTFAPRRNPREGAIRGKRDTLAPNGLAIKPRALDHSNLQVSPTAVQRASRRPTGPESSARRQIGPEGQFLLGQADVIAGQVNRGLRLRNGRRFARSSTLPDARETQRWRGNTQNAMLRSARTSECGALAPASHAQQAPVVWKRNEANGV